MALSVALSGSLRVDALTLELSRSAPLGFWEELLVGVAGSTSLQCLDLSRSSVPMGLLASFTQWGNAPGRSVKLSVGSTTPAGYFEQAAPRLPSTHMSDLLNLSQLTMLSIAPARLHTTDAAVLAQMLKDTTTLLVSSNPISTVPFPSPRMWQDTRKRHHSSSF